MKIVFDTLAFVNAVKETRGKATLRQVAKETGIGSAATVLRAETGRGLSLESFIKLCTWLGKEPGEFFKQDER